MWTKLAILIRMPIRQKLLMLEAMILLLAARLAVVLVPFKRLAGGFGKQQSNSEFKMQNSEFENQKLVDDEAVRRLGSMVQRVAKYVPWKAKCLEQAIAVKWMLAWRGLPATVFFGVKNSQEGDLKAHAWVRSGRVIATGGRNHRQFKVINVFGDKG